MTFRTVAALLLVGATLPAQAAGWYVVGAVSQSQVALDQGALDGELTANGATALKSNKSGTHDQWRLQLGYRVTPNLSLEAGYIDLGKAYYSASFTGGTASADWQSGGLDIAAVGTLPVGHDVELLGKLGVVGAKTTADWHSSGIAGLPAGSASKTQTVTLLGLGASYPVSARSRVRLEYEHFAGVGDPQKTGRADINTVSIGLSYQL